MLVIGMALHNIPEGLAIGVGFALTPALGMVIALGIAAQDVPIATIVPLYGLTKKKNEVFYYSGSTI
jgi:ZIP family zinc transporter